MDVFHAPDALNARPVFEPNHVVLSKLLLERLCNPSLDVCPRLLRQVSLHGLGWNRRFGPTYEVEDARLVTIWPVIDEDLGVAGIRIGSEIDGIEVGPA